jgi:hypothetical protein
VEDEGDLFPDGEVVEKSAPIAANGQAMVQVLITHPQLWWPNGYGAQLLYQVQVAIGETSEVSETSEVYDAREYKIEPVWIDCQSDPAKGTQAYEQAVVQDGIQAGILNWHSSVAVALMEVTAKHKIPHFFGFGATEVVNETFASDPEKYGVLDDQRVAGAGEAEHLVCAGVGGCAMPYFVIGQLS